MNKNSIIFIAGHNGLVGSSIYRRLINDGYKNLITKSHKELNLISQAQVRKFFNDYKPEYVFFAGGKTGGVYANDTYRADFIFQNLMMECNVINCAFETKVKKLLFFSCACIYPKIYQGPISEDKLLTGEIEPTNEPFALAKISGMKLCESYNYQYGTNFISIVPANLYGPYHHYDPLNSIVVPSLMQRCHEAKLRKDSSYTIWGDGTAIRDFLFVDDLADASIFIMSHYDGMEFINIGSGVETNILDLANLIKDVVKFEGSIASDLSMLSGSDYRVPDITKLKSLGWEPKTNLANGLEITYKEMTR